MGNPQDPTKVTQQAALTTSTGRVWMIVGTLVAIICAGVLIMLIPIRADIAMPSAIIVVALYVAMWVVRISVKPQRPRLLTLAILFGAILVVTLTSVLFINASAWSIV